MLSVGDVQSWRYSLLPRDFVSPSDDDEEDMTTLDPSLLARNILVLDFVFMNGVSYAMQVRDTSGYIVKNNAGTFY